MSIAPDWRSAGRVHVWTRGDRLRAARENMPGSPSQAQFAALIGFSKNTVARYERDEAGDGKPLVVVQWARVTGYSYEWLQSGVEEGLSEATLGVTIRYPATAA